MNAVAVDRDTREAVEEFMFREAELLDGGGSSGNGWVCSTLTSGMWFRCAPPVRIPRVGWARSRIGTTTTRAWRCGSSGGARRISRGRSHLGRGPGTSCPTSARLPDRRLMS